MSLIQNKKVYLNYEIQETFSAGIELFGFEVKSLRKKQGSLEGAYIITRGNEVFLIGATIPPYQPTNTPDNYDPARNRKLLLTKKEIERFSSFEKQKGLTIVPISVYNKEIKIKIKIGVAKGKKKYDKRESIKKKDTERDLKRTLKRNINL
ncbi:SsrA-binding protein [Candidatus Campbellbacteria bacterium RIFCSPLOWO2_02_35_12]|uniref:SsrA-binding protein n=1 Tax=Candidatus Campbellbacteria bacterium RIFCSPLOWO2_02_35_12 TaxID=1797580 RepID=A0A1F5EG33_9BACT|nr:MAG: SsrA-binding protein [Candidatus Campbellbacteria bacterium RIFCSPLOWO2_02_35_12]